MVLHMSSLDPGVTVRKSNFVVSPDDQVLTELQAAEFCGISKDTLRRRNNRGDGPKRLRLSARRVGYRLRDLRAWLDSNVEETRS
jgi:predicted DNA-binding transcriptional regulator AlpA